MNGKNFFRACCNQMGIHCDTRFKLGAQNSKNSGGYVYHCPPELRTREQRYAVNYISDRDIYLAVRRIKPFSACGPASWKTWSWAG